MKAAFGWDDIDFESAEFSRKYFVKCEDKRWAYDVLHGRVMELLLRVQGYSFEGDGRMIMVRAGEKRFSLAEFERAFQLVATILKEIPDHAKERAAYHA